MKYATNNQTMKEWKEDFNDFEDVMWFREFYICDIILYFKWITVWSKVWSEPTLKHKRRLYKNLCNDFRSVSSEKLGDVKLFIQFVIRMIEKEWITKDEAIDILRDFPDTDVLVEVIKYDKPLCVNRWEI